jgi:hypothetical protein
MRLHRDDVKVIALALKLAAGRRESMVRAGWGKARGSIHKHDKDAERMRALQAHFEQELAATVTRDINLEVFEP